MLETRDKTTLCFVGLNVSENWEKKDRRFALNIHRGYFSMSSFVYCIALLGEKWLANVLIFGPL